VTTAWCVLSCFVVATCPSSYPSRWWLQILWLSLLAAALTVAARRFAPARTDEQITR
jgi:membrane protein implicated in regulation of membrane protease activity